MPRKSGETFFYRKLSKFVNREDAEKIIRILEEYKIIEFRQFDSFVAIKERLGPGVYLFLNCYRVVDYIGHSKEMRERMRGHVKLYFGDEILTISLSEKEAKKLEERLIIELRPDRNKIKTIQNRRGWR